MSSPIRPRVEQETEKLLRKQKEEEQLYLHPLLVRKQICRNMTMDGDFLSYEDAGNGDVGLYVDKNRIDDRGFFEVEIVSMGKLGKIGLVPCNYPENLRPGWGKDSVGYHAGNGFLYRENGSMQNFGPKCRTGDLIGCGLKLMQGRGGNRCEEFGENEFHNLSAITRLALRDRRPAVFVVFTRNGRKIKETEIDWNNSPVYDKPLACRYPAVGMHSTGEKVKVILDSTKEWM